MITIFINDLITSAIQAGVKRFFTCVPWPDIYFKNFTLTKIPLSTIIVVETVRVI